MSKIHIHQVDVFTNKVFGGNPAGVVSDASGLRVEDMQNIAREMNLSETAFVVEPTVKEADIKFRFFTMGASEIDLCGHATVGALSTLAELGLYGLGNEGRNDVRIETGAGVLNMSVINTEGDVRIGFTAPPLHMEEYHLQGAAFADAFALPIAALSSEARVYVDRKLNYVYIPVTSLEALGGLQFHLPKICEGFALDQPVAFCLFAPETFDPGADVHVRVTCPFIGIAEDPFTGSTLAGMVYAAKKAGHIDRGARRIVVEQGAFLHRPGSAIVHYNATKDQTIIEAQATKVFSAEMEL